MRSIRLYLVKIFHMVLFWFHMVLFEMSLNFSMVAETDGPTCCQPSTYAWPNYFQYWIETNFISAPCSWYLSRIPLCFRLWGPSPFPKNVSHFAREKCHQSITSPRTRKLVHIRRIATQWRVRGPQRKQSEPTWHQAAACAAAKFLRITSARKSIRTAPEGVAWIRPSTPSNAIESIPAPILALSLPDPSRATGFVPQRISLPLGPSLTPLLPLSLFNPSHATEFVPQLISCHWVPLWHISCHWIRPSTHIMPLGPSLTPFLPLSLTDPSRVTGFVPQLLSCHCLSLTPLVSQVGWPTKLCAGPCYGCCVVDDGDNNGCNDRNWNPSPTLQPSSKLLNTSAHQVENKLLESPQVENKSSFSTCGSSANGKQALVFHLGSTNWKLSELVFHLSKVTNLYHSGNST